MTDGQKRKVWFEWCASSHLSASALIFAPSPPGSSAGSFHPRPQSSADTLSPTGATPPWDSRRSVGTRDTGGNFSPLVDAFASAPSPRMSHERDSGRMQGLEEEDESARAQGRILVGYSKLVNPGGRTSWLGL